MWELALPATIFDLGGDDHVRKAPSYRFRYNQQPLLS
jgi:hypothetical protein